MLSRKDREVWEPKFNGYADACAVIAKEIPRPEYTDCIQSNARRFFKADESAGMAHPVRCTDWRSARTAIFAIEAVHHMNAGSGHEETAIKLLRMAPAEMEQAKGT
jgi:hypothetical protein